MFDLPYDLAFEDRTHFSRDNDREPDYYYFPLGPCIRIGWFENVFGDTNCIIKKEVFRRLGGFKNYNNREPGNEDWEFYIKLCAQGFTLDTIPYISVYLYRNINENSLRKFKNKKRDGLRVLDTYIEEGLLNKSSIETIYLFSNYYKDLLIKNYSLTNEVQTLTNEVQTLTNEVQTLTNEVQTLTNEVQTLTNKIQTLTKSFFLENRKTSLLYL